MITYGIDLSSYNIVTDFGLIKKSGIRFAYIRMGGGGSFKDSLFDGYYQGLQSVGIKIGGYFYYNSESIVLQKNNLKNIAKVQFDLPIAIDFEITCNNKATDMENIITLLSLATELTGKKAVLYTSPGWLNGYLPYNPERLLGYKLWVANWTKIMPTIPYPFIEWFIWQFTNRLQLPGVNKPVDGNLYVGSLDELLTDVNS